MTTENPERLWVYTWIDGSRRATEAMSALVRREDQDEYVRADVAAAAVETERQRTWAGTVGEGKKMLDEARAINTALRAEVEALRGRVEKLRSFALRVVRLTAGGFATISAQEVDGLSDDVERVLAEDEDDAAAKGGST